MRGVVGGSRVCACPGRWSVGLLPVFCCCSHLPLSILDPSVQIVSLFPYYLLNVSRDSFFSSAIMRSGKVLNLPYRCSSALSPARRKTVALSRSVRAGALHRTIPSAGIGIAYSRHLYVLAYSARDSERSGHANNPSPDQHVRISLDSVDYGIQLQTTRLPIVPRYNAGTIAHIPRIEYPSILSKCARSLLFTCRLHMVYAYFLFYRGAS